jgi:hypothetical protein
VLIIPDTYTDERSVKSADRGVVLAVTPKRVPCRACGGDRGTWCEDHEDCTDPCDPCSMCDGRGWMPDASLRVGDRVFYLGPADKLAIEWDDKRAFAVSFEEVIGVIE